jgi:hypothetical protein
VIILGWTIILKCILEKQGLKNWTLSGDI